MHVCELCGVCVGVHVCDVTGEVCACMLPGNIDFAHFQEMLRGREKDEVLQHAL